MQEFIFGIFLFLSVIFSTISIFGKDDVKKILSLLGLFFSVAIIMLFLKAEFIATMLIVVYMGAIGVLFLFAIMFISDEKVKNKFHLDLKTILFISIGIMISIIIFSGFINSKLKQINLESHFYSILDINRSLFTNYWIEFYWTGIILFISMIGSIKYINKKNV